MPQGQAIASSTFARLMQRVTKDYEHVHIYLDDAIAHDADLRHYVKIIHNFL